MCFSLNYFSRRNSCLTLFYNCLANTDTNICDIRSNTRFTGSFSCDFQLLQLDFETGCASVLLERDTWTGDTESVIEVFRMGRKCRVPLINFAFATLVSRSGNHLCNSTWIISAEWLLNSTDSYQWLGWFIGQVQTRGDYQEILRSCLIDCHLARSIKIKAFAFLDSCDFSIIANIIRHISR